MSKDVQSSNYIPISIGLLRPNCPFTFNIYVKINEKYLHYVRKGDDLDESRIERFAKIQRLKEKDVSRLFIPKDERKVFDRFIEDEIDEAVESKDLAIDEKFEMIQEIATTAVEVSFEEPDSLEAFELTEKAAKGLRKIVTGNPNALKKIFSKKTRETAMVQQHCSNVAAIALKLGFSCGFRGEDLDNLGAAALLHDIGIKCMKQDEIDILFPRPRSRLTSSDKAVFQSHVTEGLRLLSKKDFINPKILKLIATHEEEIGGTGYPEKLETLEPLTQILALADRYDKKISLEGKDPVEGFKELKKEEIGKIELKYFDKLKEIVKIIAAADNS